MMNHTRRDFFRQVGAGALTAVAGDLGFGLAFAQDEPRLTFGALEPLVSLLQETPIAKLQPLLVAMVKEGKTDLKTLTAAAALANARTFGGQDYIGFHTFMALAPAYRDVARAAEGAGRAAGAEGHPPQHQPHPGERAAARRKCCSPCKRRSTIGKPKGNALPGDAMRGRRGEGANASWRNSTRTRPARPTTTSSIRAGRHQRPPGRPRLAGVGAAGHRRQGTRRDAAASVGALLRQRGAALQAAEAEPAIRRVLPKLMDSTSCSARDRARRRRTTTGSKDRAALYAATPEQAAEIAAAALADGIAPDAVQEAISVAANQMVLRDENKQAHGSTNGVHCCDAVNAWRHIARVSSAKNACAATVLAAYHFAFDRDNPKRNKFQEWLPYPRQEARDAVKTDDPAELLRELDAAVRNKDQARAAAVTARSGGLDAPSAPVFALFRRY